jgi:hypothetical protein
MSTQWNNFTVVNSLIRELDAIRRIMAEEKDGYTFENISYQMAIRYLVTFYKRKTI